MGKTNTVASQAKPSYEELEAMLSQTQERLAMVQKEANKSDCKAEARLARMQAKLDVAKADLAVEKGKRKAVEKELDTYKVENTRQLRDLDRLCKAIAALDNRAAQPGSQPSHAVQEALKVLRNFKQRQERYLKQLTETRKQLEKTEQSISALKEKAKELKKLENAFKKVCGAEDYDKIKNFCREIDKTRREIQKLKTQNARNFRNSGITSAASPNTPVRRKKRTGKPAGAPENHPPRPRKKLQGEPLWSSEVTTPGKFLDPSRYEPTDEMKRHQLQTLMVQPVYTEMWARGYRNLKTGKVEFPKFPPGYYNDVNFSGTIKAILYWLTHRANVSIGKTREFMRAITNGVLDISTGCICKLAREFSEKTKEERDELFKLIAGSRIMHADFTYGRMDGMLASVLITATPDGHVLYQYREKRGLAAIKDSPLEFFEGILVSDHESTFVLHCGKEHQECLQHILRALREIADKEKEKDVTWAELMIPWIQDAIHYRNQILIGEESPTQEKHDKLLERYHDILNTAEGEYAQFRWGEPIPGYTKGHNLFKRMKDKSDDYLLFLEDLAVPPTNAICEYNARQFKRKSHSVITFRSSNGVAYYCDGQSVIQEWIREGLDVFNSMGDVFDRPTPTRNRCARGTKPKKSKSVKNTDAQGESTQTPAA